MKGMTMTTPNEELIAYRLRKVAERTPEGDSDHDLFLDAADALAAVPAPTGADRGPQPGDGPDYHAEHAYWKARQENTATLKTQDGEAREATEYGYNTGSTTTWIGGREQIEAWAAARGMAVGTGDWGSRVMRRHPAGPWVPVSPEGGE